MILKIDKKSFLLFFLLSLVFILVNNSNELEVVSFLFKMVLSVVSVLFFLYAIISLAQLSRLNKDVLYIFILFFLFALYTGGGAFFGSNTAMGLQRSFQLFSVLGVIYVFYSLAVKGGVEIGFRVFRYFVLFLVFVNFAIFIVVGRKYSGFLINPNLFGIWMVVLVLVCLSAEKHKGIVFYLALVFGSSLVYFSGSRTAMLSFLMGLMILLLPYRFLKLPIFKKGIFFFLVLFSFFVIYFTLYFDLEVYNEAVRETSGKNLQSGRHIIWPIAMKAISLKPFWGWGSGFDLSNLIGSGLSAHNYFIQLMLQSGFIGLFLFLLIIYKVYNILFSVENKIFFKLSLSCFCGLIITQSFEVTIFQNNLALSYPVWAIVGLTIGLKSKG